MGKKKTERVFTPVSNLKEYLAVLNNHGEKTAYRYPQNNEYYSITYKEFYEMIISEAAGLSAMGLAGKRIAVIGETSVEWVSSYLAALAAGGIIIPMDKELDISAIGGLLESVEAETIIFSKTFYSKMTELKATHSTLKKFICMQDTAEADDGVYSLNEIIKNGREYVDKNGFSVYERGAEDLAVMLFTSGTTGTSKCVMLCEKNIFSTVNSACATVEFFPDDTIVSVLPLHHTYELACMLSGLNYGMEVGINDSIRHFAKNFKEFKPTGLVLVPLIVNTMHSKIMNEAKKSHKYALLRTMMALSNGLRKVGIDLRHVFFKEVLGAFGGRLCKIISGGAPLNPKMVKEFDSLGITIAEGYGITECSPLISVNPYYALKKGSVGPSVPSCKVRIDKGTEKNEKGYYEGEIQVKGSNVMLGYYNNKEENAKAFTVDGWYKTGDIGYMDKDGYIYITGRLKSVIVLENGKNVFPEEIEEYLSKITEIGECVVVGRKGEDGETVNLTVIAYPNPEIFGETPDEAKAYEIIRKKVVELNRKLPSFKHIKAVEIRKEPFEKTTSRKIKRHLVK